MWWGCSNFHHICFFMRNVLLLQVMDEIRKQIVVFDRVELYSDFVSNLIHYIFHYYIDDGSFDDEDIDKFYDWCYDKVCAEFMEEDIDFSKNNTLRQYFKTYFNENYFYANSSLKSTYTYYLDNWKSILDPQNVENNKNIDTFILVYSMFDKTINNKRLIKEKISIDENNE